MKHGKLLACMLTFLFLVGGLGYIPETASAQDEEKVLKVGVLGDLESLNPILAWTEYAWLLIPLIYEPLVRWNISGGGDWRIVPGMAESWEWADNGTQVTFHLVQNATWHDGTPFTSADVNWTLFTWTWLGWWISSQSHTDHHSIQVIDDYTIALNFVDWGLPDMWRWDTVNDTTPMRWYRGDYNGTPAQIAREYFLMTIPYLPIFPMHLWDPLMWHSEIYGIQTDYHGYYNYTGPGESTPWIPTSFFHNNTWKDAISWGVLDYTWAEPRIGTGPFVFDEWVPGESVRLTAYDDYHYGRVPLDALEFITYSTVETMTQGVVVGDIDFTSTSVTFTELTDFGPDVEVVENDFMGYRMLFINQFEEYLNASGMYEGRGGSKHNALLDPDVRKAIHQSLDKDRIADVAYLGTARAANSPIHDSLMWHNDAMVEYTYGDTAAIATLEDAGWVLNADDLWEKEIDGVNETLSFDLKYVAGDPIAFVEAQLLEEDIEATGIAITTVPVEASTFVSDMTEGTWNYALATDFWTQLGDPNHYIWYLRSDSGLNPNNIEIDRIDELFKEQQLTPDYTARKALVDEFQQIVYDDSSIIPLVYYKDVEIYRSDRWDFRPQDRTWTSGIFSVHNQAGWMNVDVAEATPTPPPPLPVEMIVIVAGAAVVIVVILAAVWVRRK
ncbi:MAG: ABC transporter substrate-binding protein [Candidatus Thorarchaeota archaeon]|jgi:ABC-type transport system substrate-binding protein